ncbi:PKD domain-containing protein [Lentzea atacamensis]|uniref:PKD domain-containing protein n=1 Tax=Lentzea atacamensis TaxID=531938 RepID=A0A316HQT4_9PSEU|nr:PKD domain-containing protein [Lentzea atacamensis]PWK82307.1 PKD domain-containing protein [Lentzea atacamensis]
MANDYFANAQQVTSLPFSAPQPDFSLASAEPDEPVTTACPGVSEGTPTVWYTYTPTTTQSIFGQVVVNGGGGPVLGVYEGSALAELKALGCVNPSYYNGKAFRLVAGTTYHLQLQYSFYDTNTATMRLSEAPPLEVEVSSGASGEQSIFHDITFRTYPRNHYDQPVTTEWDFGDGTILPPSTDSSKTYRYAKDGNYTVTVRSTSQDGRTATDTTTVVVKTHDVGIAKFITPASARVGSRSRSPSRCRTPATWRTAPRSRSTGTASTAGRKSAGSRSTCRRTRPAR